ncbi:MAG: hypothetical protein AAB386_04555 [Patescibacteria group bacterium]
MKGCLLLQRRFAYLGHGIACHLKERYGVSEFCGYVYLRSSYRYLKSQTDIQYTTLLLDENIHEQYKNEQVDPAYLSWLEKEYGIPNLWPFLTVDRVLISSQLVREYPHDRPMYSHENLLRILQAHARALESLLERERPDFFFGSVLGGVGSYLLYSMCKRKGIKTLILHPTPLTGNTLRYLLSEKYEEYTSVDSLYKSFLGSLHNSPSIDNAQNYLKNFRHLPTTYYKKASPSAQSVTRKKQLKFLHPLNAWRSLSVFARNILNYYSNTDRFDYSCISPWSYLKDLVKRKTRNIIGLTDLYDQFDPTVDFAFFPLQLEPEISSLLHAPFWTNQINLAKQIARSLPIHYKLVVKEHPQMVEYRTRSFYRELKKIPNLVLVNPIISSFQITPKAKIIFTLTGSVGWEGALLGKPIISFGHWFYNILPHVTHCTNIEALPSLVNELLSNPLGTDVELITYIAALLEETIEINIPHLWEDEPDLEKKKEGVRPLADILAKKLGLH